VNVKHTRMLAVIGVALLAALSPAAVSAHPDNGTGTSSQTASALLLRSQGMNQQLHLGVTGRADLRSPDTRDAAAAASAATPVVESASSTGFDWGTAWVITATVALGGLLALSAAAVIRRRPTALWS
jgi:hypothetical protein